MAEPRWAWHEPYDAENHPEGNEDVFNRAAKDFYALYDVGHVYSSGAHRLKGFLRLEQGQYTGTGIAHAESLTDSSIDIFFAMVSRPDTEYPVIKSLDMSDTKQVGTNAFQTGMITDITTTGQFTVGTDIAVNELNIVYDYVVYGVYA